jgi:hypothetical protein
MLTTGAGGQHCPFGGGVGGGGGGGGGPPIGGGGGPPIGGGGGGGPAGAVQVAARTYAVSHALMSSPGMMPGPVGINDCTCASVALDTMPFAST